MNINEILGNEKVKHNLINAIKNNTVVNSYLFVGTDGIGKKEIAKEFARMLFCEAEDIQNDSECRNCRKFLEDNLIDFKLIEAEGKTIKIDQIRTLNEDIYKLPIETKKKVYIINDSELMTEEAQNALLKTLEEPPKYALIILITSREDLILTTIKSRCTRILFNDLSEDLIKEYINKNMEDKDIDENIIKMSSGSIGKLLRIKENYAEIVELEKIVLKLIQNKENSKAEFLKNMEKAFAKKSRESIPDIIDFIEVLFFETLKKENNIDRKNAYINIVKKIESAKNKIATSRNQNMTIDDLSLYMWEEINENHSRN